MRRLFTLVLAVGLPLTACSDTRTRPSGTSEPGLFFATEPDERGAMMLALHRGPLVVRDGCVLIGSPGDYSVPIWWNGFTAERDESGQLVVRDGDRTVVAVEGETFEMGGGYVAEFRPKRKVEPREDQVRRLEEWLGYPVPERCLRPDIYGFWSVGDT
jgi:hypothetical protein